MRFVPLTEFRQSYLLSLGNIVIAAGHLEQQLFVLLARMLDDVSLAANLTFGCHLDKVIEILKAVFYAKKESEEATTVFEYIMDELNRLITERNKNFHCQWLIDDNSKTAMRAKFSKHKRGRLKAPDWTRHVPLGDLQKLGGELWEYQDELLTFGTAYFPNSKMPIPPGEEEYVRRCIEKQLDTAKKYMSKKTNGRAKSREKATTQTG